MIAELLSKQSGFGCEDSADRQSNRETEQKMKTKTVEWRGWLEQWPLDAIQADRVQPPD